MPDKRRLSPPPAGIENPMPYQWVNWFEQITSLLGECPLKVPAYSVTDLGTPEMSPARWGSVTAAKEFTSLVFVHDESGGPCLAFSDGTFWRQAHSPTTTIS